MSSELYIPISTVADLKSVKSLTTNLDILVEALKESSQVTVDSTGTKVKPNFTVRRNTIILRDISSEVSLEEIRGIFSGDKNPTIQDAHPDVGGTWFITFEMEEDALKMLNFIRGKTFQGKPIAGRIKSENILKGFYKHDVNPNTTQRPDSYTIYSDSHHTNGTNPYDAFEYPYTNDMQHNSYSPHYEKPEYKRRFTGSYRGKGENRNTNKEQHQSHQQQFYPDQHQIQQARKKDKQTRSGQVTRTQDSESTPVKEHLQLNHPEKPEEFGKVEKTHYKKQPSITPHNNQTDQKNKWSQYDKPLQPGKNTGKPGSEQFPPLPSRSGNSTPTQQDRKAYSPQISISEIVKGIKPGDFKSVHKMVESLERDAQESNIVKSEGIVENEEGAFQAQKQPTNSKERESPEKPNKSSSKNTRSNVNEMEPLGENLGVRIARLTVDISGVSYAQILRQKQQKTV
ncbi:hypothetical protein K7432_000569 [Basidiobolus ranarum]